MDTNFSDDFQINGKFSIKKSSTAYNGKLTKEEGVQLLIQEKKSFVNFRKSCMLTEPNLCSLYFRRWMLPEKTA